MYWLSWILNIWFKWKPRERIRTEMLRYYGWKCSVITTNMYRVQITDPPLKDELWEWDLPVEVRIKMSQSTSKGSWHILVAFLQSTGKKHGKRHQIKTLDLLEANPSWLSSNSNESKNCQRFLLSTDPKKQFLRVGTPTSQSEIMKR